MLTKFEIPHRSRRCCLGTEEFIPGTEYVSVLKDVNEKIGYTRQDYCLVCWEKILKNPNENCFGKIHWKSAVPLKKKESGSNLRRDERAMELLREIQQNGTEEEAPEAFVLALLLNRNKLLQLKQEIKEEGQTRLLYEIVGTEEMIGVHKLTLSTNQIENIQTMLIQKLNPR